MLRSESQYIERPARDGVRSENNRRETEAYAVFAQNRFGFGRFSVTPGLRFESVDYLRRNRLNGAEGDETLDEVIPSLGATFQINDRYTAFASAHRGFAPRGWGRTAGDFLLGGILETTPLTRHDRPVARFARYLHKHPLVAAAVSTGELAAGVALAGGRSRFGRRRHGAA